MDTHRKLWNEGHQKLQHALSTGNYPNAVDLFLSQHAMVHSRQMSKSQLWSFEDEVLRELSEEQIRCVPPRAEHSIVWILFHLARIEDITMNLLVAGSPQLFLQEGWAEKLNVTVFHSANKMDEAGVERLSTQMDIRALRSYRQSVGRSTQEIVRQLRPAEFKQRANPSRLQEVMDQGALLPEAIEILHYWSKRTVAGLLLMPPTRHNFLHLNEALRVKQKIVSS
jgi:hypothetical protein